jgi:hypothetical protein
MPLDPAKRRASKRHPSAGCLQVRSRMPRDPVKRNASKQRYNQSDKGQASKQRYLQSDKGKAIKQAYAQRAAAERAASTASAASTNLAFVTELKKLTHAQRVKAYFSQEELAAAADQVPYCPFYYSGGSEFRSCSPEDPRFLVESRRAGEYGRGERRPSPRLASSQRRVQDLPPSAPSHTSSRSAPPSHRPYHRPQLHRNVAAAVALLKCSAPAPAHEGCCSATLQRLAELGALLTSRGYDVSIRVAQGGVSGEYLRQVALLCCVARVPIAGPASGTEGFRRAQRTGGWLRRKQPRTRFGIGPSTQAAP